MPANLTPEYKAVEAAFRQARDPRGAPGGAAGDAVHDPEA